MKEITANTDLDIEKEFKIEAGPGAGKTRFLIHHINNVIKKSHRLYSARKVACITFTNTAVDTIRQRLGHGAIEKTEVSTIHSFLYNNIVKPYGRCLLEEYGLRIEKVDGHEDAVVNRKILNQWLEMDVLSGLRHPNSQKQLKTRSGLTAVLKKWLLSEKCIVRKGNIEWIFNDNVVAYTSEGRFVLDRSSFKVLKSGFMEYKKLYWEKGIVDHEDVLFFSGILIQKCPFILTILRAKYPYIFVDEFQDTNPIQTYILAEIKKEESIVGVIGDAAQAIYGFQGADIQLFRKYKVKKENEYSLNENHRSDEYIVDFLNILRENFEQIPCEEYEDSSIKFFVGDRTKAFLKARDICGLEELVSLSRDNVTSNAMKNLLENEAYDSKIMKKFEEIEKSNPKRMNYVIAYINAIELARNSKFKEAIKKIEWLYRDQAESKKIALNMLLLMLKSYSDYSNMSLMNFYLLLKGLEKNVQLSNFKTGSIKSFYENTLYINLAICVNIVEDISNHITIHKAKGAEYENVFVVGNSNFLDFLMNPDIAKNEEHRVFYVALSRAKKRLFLFLDELSLSDENYIGEKYAIKIERIG